MPCCKFVLPFSLIKVINLVKVAGAVWKPMEKSQIQIISPQKENNRAFLKQADFDLKQKE